MSNLLAPSHVSSATSRRVLRPPLRYAAVASLGTCTVMLLFVGPLLAWIAGVAICSLAYLRVVTFRERGGVLS